MSCDHPREFRRITALGPNGDLVGDCEICGEVVREVVSDVTVAACEVMDMMEDIFMGRITPAPSERLIALDPEQQKHLDSL